MSEQENKPKSNKTLTVLSYVVGAILLAVVIWAILAYNSSNNDTPTNSQPVSHNVSLTDGSNVSFTETRLAIAKSALDGSGEITEIECSTLSAAAKNFNSSAQWFSDCDSSFMGSTPDTDSEYVTKLSDGDYCATYVTDKEVTVLTDYTFVEGSCGDYRISVK